MTDDKLRAALTDLLDYNDGYNGHRIARPEDQQTIVREWLATPAAAALAASATGEGTDLTTQAEREQLILANIPAPASHGVAIYGGYGVTCSCGAVLDWPDGWNRTEVGSQKLIERHALPAVPALDVERLTRAVDAHMVMFTADPESFDSLRAVAENIAREYAALSPKEPTE